MQPDAITPTTTVLGIIGLVVALPAFIYFLVAALGVDPGDRLLLTGENPRATPLEVVVAAVWRPVDAEDPRWFGEADGAVWVDEAVLDRVPATVRVRWTVVPEIRLYTQRAASFYYDPVYDSVLGEPVPPGFPSGPGRFSSPDQRLSGFGAGQRSRRWHRPL